MFSSPTNLKNSNFQGNSKEPFLELLHKTAIKGDIEETPLNIQIYIYVYKFFVVAK